MTFRTSWMPAPFYTGTSPLRHRVQARLWQSRPGGDLKPEAISYEKVVIFS